MDARVAVLVDGSFFIRRVQFYQRKYFAHTAALTAEQTVKVLQKITYKHLLEPKGKLDKEQNYHLYRLFFYDAAPLSIKVHLPLKEPSETHHRVLDYAKTPENLYRLALIECLKKQRKYAVRMGTLKHNKEWRLNPKSLKKLLKNEAEFSELTNEDFSYDVRQKGVDIKLGVDIATLAIKKQVDKIILIAGDSDFVPAAKLARVEGVDFVLDALHNNIDNHLNEHIDGLVSYDVVSILKEVLQSEPNPRPKWWQPS